MINYFKELYLNLIDKGWNLNDIDEMDIYYYLDITSYEANKEVRVEIKRLDDAGL